MQCYLSSVGKWAWRNKASYASDDAQFQVNQRRRAWRGSDWNVRNGIYINQNQGRYNDQLSQVGLGAQDTSTDITIVGVRNYWEHIGDKGTFAIHSELKTDELEEINRVSGRQYDASRRSLDSSIQYSLFQLKDALLITPAVRFRSLRDNYGGVTRQGKNRIKRDNASLQLGAKYTAGSWQWLFNLGQHKREPQFHELFGDRGFYIGNDRLVPEEGINFDAGWHWQSDEHKAREARVTLFANFRDELIVTTYDARGVGRSENTGKARIVGVESVLNWRWSKAWSSKLNMTWQSALNLNQNVAFKGKQLPGEAQFNAFASVNYHLGSWRGWLECHSRTDRYYDTANLRPAREMLLFNGGFAYRRNSGEVTFHLLNLGDSSVEDFNGSPRPGRSVEISYIHYF